MLPFDKIKIAKSFTQNVTKRSDCSAIVAAVLALGSGLGIKTVAEGVETEEQFLLLRAAGVDIVQGFLFSRPCPGSELCFGINDDVQPNYGAGQRSISHQGIPRR
jgi:EAL domain-containing protein (putative c-di-GMP-specific phosphodiesterase class I)